MVKAFLYCMYNYLAKLFKGLRKEKTVTSWNDCKLMLMTPEVTCFLITVLYV